MRSISRSTIALNAGACLLAADPPASGGDRLSRDHPETPSLRARQSSAFESDGFWSGADPAALDRLFESF